MAAAARGHLECIQLLIKSEGIEVNSQNVDGHTALMFAYNGKNQVETLWERYSQFVTNAELERRPRSPEVRQMRQLTRRMSMTEELVHSSRRHSTITPRLWTCS